MKKILLIATLSLFLSSILFAKDAPKAYQACSPCHGEHGEMVALGKSRIIKNMSKADIVEAIKIYKYGALGEAMSPLMVSEVQKLTPSQIQEIADYIGK